MSYGSRYRFDNAFVLLVLVLQLAATAARGGSSELLWVERVGDSTDQRALSAATDAAGNLYVGGHFSGTTDFDPGPGVVPLSGANDAYLAKYTAAGELVWVRPLLGGAFGGDDGVSALVVDASAIYVCGVFFATFDADPGPGTTTLTADGGRDVFCGRYDAATGDLVWVFSLGGDTGDDTVVALRVDASGRLLVTGMVKNSVDLDPGAGVFQVDTPTRGSLFLARYDADGTFSSAISMGLHLGQVTLQDMVHDSTNAIYLVGWLDGDVAFDPSVPQTSLRGSNDAFIARYDASLTLDYVSLLSSPPSGLVSQNAVLGAAVEPGGDLVVAGTIVEATDFDPAAGTAVLTPAGLLDVFLARYTSGGDLVWAELVGGTDFEDVTAIGWTSDGHIVAGGRYRGAPDLDPGPGEKILPAPSFNNNTFLARYLGDGSFVDGGAIVPQPSFSGNARAVITSIVPAASGTFFFAGYFGSDVDFDPGPGEQSLSSAGSHDTFFGLFGEPPLFADGFEAGSAVNWSAVEP